MSDENQPDEVVESQPEPEVMPAKLDAAASDATPEHAADTAATARLEEEPSASAGVDVETTAVGTTAVSREVAFSVSTGAEAARPEPAVTAPALVSIADLERPRRARGTGGDGVPFSVASFLQGRGWIAGAVVAVLLLVFLFLPPISLAQRLSSGGGYTVLDDATTMLEHPDGLTVSRAAGATGRLRVKLGSIPRADLVSGKVPDDLSGAVQAIPAYLTPKSPYYTIDMKTKDPVAGAVTVLIPNEAEPWETLDLYTWNGQVWQWLPTSLDREREILVSVVDTIPSSVVVMQSSARAQRIVAEVEQWPVEGVDPVIAEVGVPGILIGTMGGTSGNVADLPPSSAGGQTLLAPMVRNWLPGREANWALVSDMVGVAADRTTHVANLVALAQDGGYPGVIIDYRNVQPQDRALYADFIEELGTAFGSAGLGLAVMVDPAQRSGDGSWDTGGYDWAAIGASADQIRVPMPLSPVAYAPGGDVEQLIAWAVTQVDRHKLFPVYSTLSTDGEQPVTLDTVLGSIGQIKVMQTLTESVLPATKLDLSLGTTAQMETDAATEATRVSVGNQTYWLGTPRWLGARMALLARYQVGGVVLRDLFAAGNVVGMAPAIAEIQTVGGGAVSLPEVIWEVTGPGDQKSQTNTPISQPEFAWTAPEVTGTYRIAAALGGLDKGALEILVAAPAPVVTDTLTEGDAEIESGAAVEPAEPEGEADPSIKAGFVTDVSVPDNTRFEKGEEFTKTWRMRNSGSVDWPEDTIFVFASGAELGTEKQIEVGAVESGEDIDLSVAMVAPEEDGSYKSTWELRAANKAIRGGSVYVVIQVGEPVAAPPPLAAPNPVASGAFELGGHIRDLGIPYNDKMHYAGMNWVKIQVHYGGGASGIIAAAHANGYKIQLSAIGGAAMTTQAGFEDKFASWVAGLAAAGADAIEVWNEPNIDREWQIGSISPQAYTNLLCKSYNAIKGANGGTAVISAAPAPTGWFGGCGPNGCDDKPWMEGLYNAGAANCMDYIGAHHNAGATSPSARIGHPASPGDTHHSWFFLPQTELYYNIFRGSRKLFYTEMGYASQEGVPTFSDQFAWGRGTDNSEQAAWLAEAVQLSINTGMVRCIIVWNIDFVRYGTDPQDGFAIIRPGGGCPACDSLHNVLGTR